MCLESLHINQPRITWASEINRHETSHFGKLPVSAYKCDRQSTLPCSVSRDQHVNYCHIWTATFYSYLSIELLTNTDSEEALIITVVVTPYYYFSQAVSCGVFDQKVSARACLQDSSEAHKLPDLHLQKNE